MDAALTTALSAEVLEAVVGLIPDEWLTERSSLAPSAARAAYRRYLMERLAPPRRFVEEARGAR